MHLGNLNVTILCTLLGKCTLKGPFSHKHQDGAPLLRQSYKKINSMIICKSHFKLFCMWLFWNTADSKNAVRSFNDTGKLSNFVNQPLDIAKFWVKLNTKTEEILQNLVTPKFWIAKLDNLPLSLKLLTAFFESAVFQKGHIQTVLKWNA